MPDYLLEVGTEELPADLVPAAQEQLKTLLSDGLREANVKFGEITTLGTPRRLTCVVHGLAAVQDTVEKKVAGPAVKSSFDPSGKALQPAEKFAEKHGLKVEQLSREDFSGTEKLVANLTIKGKPVAEVLKEVVPAAILQLSAERPMRWGSFDLKFSRPIRWIVSILDSEEVPVALEVVKSGRKTFGNRVLNPGTIDVAAPGKYVETLRAARVLADPSEREEVIKKQVQEIAAKVSGKPRHLGGALLEEVVNITEWPHAVLGEFEKEYLDLPDKLIETIMIHHQRYFPLERLDAGDSKKRLLPYFVTIANNDRKEAEATIKQGNERVIRARLADGRFFYFDDQKAKLTDRKAELDKLTFQEGLGSYQAKTERLVSAARILIDSLNLDARTKICLEQTMELCKLDLVSNLVRELPELQGYVGSWYAEKEGQPPDVVTAIASHYSPRSQNDDIPQDTVGQFAAVLDKLDHVVGLFALGRRPTGSSDPYGLRRQAQGIIDIVFDGLKNFSVNLTALIELFLALVQPSLEKKKGFDADKTIADVKDFLLQRVRTKLQEKGYRREIIDAVMGTFDPLENIQNLVVRCDAVQKQVSTPEGVDAVRAGVRIGNILNETSPGSVDAKLFEIDAEKDLWEAFQTKVSSVWEKDGHFKDPSTPEDYERMLDLLKALVKPVDAFFEKVMVNDPDVAKKNNRHGMLRLIYQYYAAVADYPKLQPLLP
jgi:glycyl-tRNA synthetase beta chain